MNPILECRGLTKNYGSFTALSNLNLFLDRGQMIGLLGPNGSGKTTLSQTHQRSARSNRWTHIDRRDRTICHHTKYCLLPSGTDILK